MNLSELKEDPRIQKAWLTAWPALEEYLAARLLENAAKAIEPAANRELALLIKDLRTVAVPKADPPKPPVMRRLNSMDEPTF